MSGVISGSGAQFYWVLGLSPSYRKGIRLRFLNLQETRFFWVFLPSKTSGGNAKRTQRRPSRPLEEFSFLVNKLFCCH